MVLVAMAVLPLLGCPHWALHAPPSWAAAGAFALALAVTVLMSAAFTVLFNASLLWTVAGEGIARLVPSAVTILSGMIVPLPMYPDGMQPVLNALPFRALADVPYRIYCGNIPARAALPILAGQLAWVAGLVLLGRWVLARGQRRVVIQGG
jgi:ABC-2 type transport system permease protein